MSFNFKTKLAHLSKIMRPQIILLAIFSNFRRNIVFLWPLLWRITHCPISIYRKQFRTLPKHLVAMAISGTPINCIDTSTLEGAVFNLRATLKKKTEEWFNYLNSQDYEKVFNLKWYVPSPAHKVSLLAKQCKLCDRI